VRKVETDGLFLVTNNPQIQIKYRQLDVECIDGSVIDLLTKVRDYIHRGHCLITHPLSGSLKPGKIPYKTVILARTKNRLDQSSLVYIENSIEAYSKTVSASPGCRSDEILEDYARVDLSHVEAALAGFGI